MRHASRPPVTGRSASRYRRRSVLPTLAALAVLLAACGGTDGAGAPSDDDVGADGGTAGQLAGDWVLVQGAGADGPVPIVDGSPITLTIDDDRWGGTAACNSYGGTVAVDGSTLEVRDVAVTEMACLDEEVMRSERAYLDAFTTVTAYALDANQLVLRGDDVELVYDEVPPTPDAEVVGTTWVLDGLVSGSGPDGAVSSVAGEPTLVLGTDGTLRGETGCNAFGAAYELDGDTLRLGEGDQTAAGCEDDLLAAQEQHVIDTFTSGEVQVAVDGDRLTLTAPNELGLTYRSSD